MYIIIIEIYCNKTYSKHKYFTISLERYNKIRNSNKTTNYETIEIT